MLVHRLRRFANIIAILNIRRVLEELGESVDASDNFDAGQHWNSIGWMSRVCWVSVSDLRKWMVWFYNGASGGDFTIFSGQHALSLGVTAWWSPPTLSLSPQGRPPADKSRGTSHNVAGLSICLITFRITSISRHKPAGAGSYHIIMAENGTAHLPRTSKLSAPPITLKPDITQSQTRVLVKYIGV